MEKSNIWIDDTYRCKVFTQNRLQANRFSTALHETEISTNQREEVLVVFLGMVVSGLNREVVKLRVVGKHDMKNIVWRRQQMYKIYWKCNCILLVTHTYNLKLSFKTCPTKGEKF